MICLLSALLAVQFCLAESAAPAEGFARDLVTLIQQTPSDFTQIRGRAMTRYTDSIRYAPTSLFSGLHTTEQWLVVYNSGTRTEFRATYADAALVAAAQSSFLGVAKIFADPRHPEYQGYTVDSQLVKARNGGSTAYVYRNGVIVAVFMVAASGDSAVLYVGMLFSEDLAADLAKMFPVPREEDDPSRHWGSEFGDAVMDLLRHAKTNFEGMIGPVATADGDDVTYSSPSILGSDKTAYFDNSRLGMALVLTFNKSNPAAKRVEREVKALFATLVKERGYTEETSAGSGNVSLGDNEVFRYWTNTDRKDPDYFMLRISQGPQSLVDESSYAGKFPTEVTESRRPQIREIRGKGTTEDSYIRENGRFKNGKLANGTRRYHGYGSFFDGVWYSPEWNREGVSYEVVFRPATSPEIIYGHFNDSGDMSTFVPDLRYCEKGTMTLKPDVPKWLVVALPVHQKEVADDKAASEAVARYNKEMLAQNRPHEDDESDHSTQRRSSSTPSAPVHQTIVQRCITCGGTGWVTTHDSFGSHREQCSECRGTGKVSTVW